MNYRLSLQWHGGDRTEVAFVYLAPPSLAMVLEHLHQALQRGRLETFDLAEASKDDSGYHPQTHIPLGPVTMIRYLIERERACLPPACTKP